MGGSDADAGGGAGWAVFWPNGTRLGCCWAGSSRSLSANGKGALIGRGDIVVCVTGWAIDCDPGGVAAGP